MLFFGKFYWEKTSVLEGKYYTEQKFTEKKALSQKWILCCKNEVVTIERVFQLSTLKYKIRDVAIASTIEIVKIDFSL